MDLSEEDQRVAVSAASAMSLKRSISSLDLADNIKRAKKAEYMKKYKARPEVKAKQAEHMKKHKARPEVKAKKAQYNARLKTKKDARAPHARRSVQHTLDFFFGTATR